MAIRVLAEIKPAGDFPVMSAENVIVSGKMLDVVLGEKVEKEDGKGLSTNDYSNSEKAKVASAANGVATLQNNKVDKVEGKGLSTNDYSNTEKAKVKQAEDDITRLNGYFTLV